jgi:alpha-tubulin suppressor-like RCC1 family protein
MDSVIMKSHERLNTNMSSSLTSVLLASLFVALTCFGFANDLNGNGFQHQERVPRHVIVSNVSEVNQPGFQEGSIFSDTTLSSGGYHTCAIYQNGSIGCWGRGDGGQLGNPYGTRDKLVSSFIPPFSEGHYATELAAGESHTCAILENGSVYCWGDGSFGALGNGGNQFQQLIPTPISDLGLNRTAITLASGGSHTCAILSDGNVSCWGLGNNGQLGNGQTGNSNVPVPVNLGNERRAVAISAGERHTCAILDNGSVACWGKGDDNQMGNGEQDDSLTPTLVGTFGSGRFAVAIASGDVHSCAILDDGTVSCWGKGSQLGGSGLGSTPQQTNSLGTGRTATSISAGSEHTCVILDDGSVSCWGSGDYGQLGIGGTAGSSLPTQISNFPGGQSAVSLSLGHSHSCAVLANLSVTCWGAGYYGQLGVNSTVNRATPSIQNSLSGSGKVMISERDFDNDGIFRMFDSHDFVDYFENSIASGDEHTCLLLDGGDVACWGSNTYGQLGNGGTTERLSPTLTSQIGQGSPAISVSAGRYHSCALNENGEVYCWGGGWKGMIGDGNTSDRSSPTLVQNLGRPAVDISTGEDFSCAVLDNGSVKCWGANSYGQLGIGNGNQNNQLYPAYTVPLAPGKSAVSITSGYSHTCVLLDNGQIACWGDNSGGQLAIASTSVIWSPTVVNNLPFGRDVISLSAGAAHTCAVLDDGVLMCWGSGGNGRLGIWPTAYQTSTPTQVSRQNVNQGAQSVSAGGLHTCALMNDSSVACWGYGDYGQLGNGGTNDLSVPTQTNGFSGNGVLSISAGRTHTCSISVDRSVNCWGDGRFGQLGIGVKSTRSSPSLINSLPGTGYAKILDHDRDGDGVKNSLDHFPDNPIRSATCPIGQFGRYACFDAPLGTYVPLSESMYFKPAEYGYFVEDVGQSNQTACNPGTYQDEMRQWNCLNASAGYYVDINLGSGQTNQTACSKGTYNPKIASTVPSDCIVASAGHYVDNVGQQVQLPCPAGTYNSLSGRENMADCLPAQEGYYVLTDAGPAQTSQTPCPTGTFNNNSGAVSLDACRLADSGYFVDSTKGPGQGNQTACPAGTYNPNNGSTSETACKDTRPGHYSPVPGQANQSPCPVGQYQSEWGATSCNLAEPGSYVDEIGQSYDSECPIGSYSSSSGATECNEADLGYYVTYEDRTQQLPADPGHYVDEVGQRLQTPCPSGTYQGLAGKSFCNNATVGYYVSSDDKTQQIPAEPGYYVDQERATSQRSCPSGSYSSEPASASCIEAPAGSYVNSSDKTRAVLAEPGYYVPSEGRSSQTSCGRGTFSNVSGATECTEAGSGFYVLDEDRTQRVQCPPFTNTYVGLMTSGNTSNNPDDCWTDTDGDGLVDDGSAQNSDDDDDNDGYNDSEDAFPLDPSKWEKPVTQLERLSAQAGKSTFYGITMLMIVSSLVFLGLISNKRNSNELEEATGSLVDALKEHDGVSKAVPVLLALSLLFSMMAMFTDEWMVDGAQELFYGLSEARADFLGVPITFSYGDLCDMATNDAEAKACTVGYGGLFIKIMMWLSILGSIGIFAGKLNQRNEFVEIKNIPKNLPQIVQITIPSLLLVSVLVWFVVNPSRAENDFDLLFGDSFWFAMVALVLSATSLALSRLQSTGLMELEKALVQVPDEPEEASVDKPDDVSQPTPPPRPIDLDTGEDEQEAADEAEEIPEDESEAKPTGPTGPPRGPPLKQTTPPSDAEGVIGDDGYEWLEFPEDSGKHFYRAPGAESWETWD